MKLHTGTLKFTLTNSFIVMCVLSNKEHKQNVWDVSQTEQV